MCLWPSHFPTRWMSPSAISHSTARAWRRSWRRADTPALRRARTHADYDSLDIVDASSERSRTDVAPACGARPAGLRERLRNLSTTYDPDVFSAFTLSECVVCRARTLAMSEAAGGTSMQHLHRLRQPARGAYPHSPHLYARIESREDQQTQNSSSCHAMSQVVCSSVQHGVRSVSASPWHALPESHGPDGSVRATSAPPRPRRQ